jgi:hypothetical protein
LSLEKNTLASTMSSTELQSVMRNSNIFLYITPIGDLIDFSFHKFISFCISHNGTLFFVTYTSQEASYKSVQ